MKRREYETVFLTMILVVLIRLGVTVGEHAGGNHGNTTRGHQRKKEIDK
jgi:hypothetical protein